jgi:hypothetical protein
MGSSVLRIFEDGSKLKPSSKILDGNGTWEPSVYPIDPGPLRRIALTVRAQVLNRGLAMALLQHPKSAAVWSFP